MFNFKLSGIAAGLAFIISLLISAISGASLPAVLLRPIFFGIVFFLIANIISLLVGRYLPELLDINAEKPEIDIPGSRLNLMEDDSSMGAPEGMYARPDDSETGMGDISHLMNNHDSALDTDAISQSGMDQSGQNEYNDESETTAVSPSGDVDGLSDLGSLVEGFLPTAGDKQEEAADNSNSEFIAGFGSGFESSKKAAPGGNVAQMLETEFSPKELAEGIRTVLKKEEG